MKKVETSVCLASAPCIRCEKKATFTLRAQWQSLDAIRNEHDYLEDIEVHSCGACTGTVAGLILHNIDPRAVGDWLIID